MNRLEIIRILLAITIIILGYATTAMILSSIAHYPEIDAITLITLDESLSKEIDEALAQPPSLRGSEVTDSYIKNALTTQSLIDGIIAAEILASGARITDFMEDEESLELAHGQNFERLHDRRRLSEDTSDKSLASAILPHLILALAGLILICAIFLCVFDGRSRPKDGEDDAEHESQEDSPDATRFSITSIAQNSYFSPLEAAENPILPPDEEEALIESEDQIQIVPSESMGNQSTRRNSENVGDQEQRTNPIWQFRYPRNILIDTVSPVPDEGDAPPAIMSDGSSSSFSPDRSAISTLTELSAFSSDNEKSSLGSSYAGRKVEITEAIETMDEVPLDTSFAANSPSPSNELQEEDLKEYHDALSRRSSTKDDMEAEEDPTVKSREKNGIGEGLAQVMVASNQPCEEDPNTNDVFLGEKNPKESEMKSISASSSDSAATKKCDYIRDIMLIGEEEGLGLETCSTTSDNHPIVTHVSDSSPLVGRVFEGDVILNVSESNIGDSESHVEREGDLLYEDQESPRCIQLTILSSHKDEESYTDATTTAGDESTEKCEV